MTDILFTNAQILDAAAGTLLPDRAVLVRDGRIAEVSDRPIKAGEAATVDLKGKVLMPGLCDGHVHVTAATPDFSKLMRWAPSYAALRAADILQGMLMRGFTTVRDAGGGDFGLAQAIEEGYIAGPRLLFCGHALSQTGGHGDMRGPGETTFDDCYCCAGLGRICDGISEVRRAARDEIRKGATHIKIMGSGGVASPTDRITSTQFSLEEIRAVVEEAEAASIYVMAHCYTPRAIIRALDAGVRSIEHGNLLNEQACAIFVKHGAFLVPTLSTYKGIAEDGPADGMPAALVAKVHEVLDAGQRALEIAYRQGVKIVYGTDLLGVSHRRQLGEFALRGEVQTPADVIRGATTLAAELFNLTGKVGTVAPGAFADLLVVDGNPLADLGVLQNPDRCLLAIMKGGVFHKNTL